jgi:basic membrane protein A and related proteins
MRSRRIAVAVVAAAALSLLGACAKKAEEPAPAGAPKPVIGLVFDVGGRGDKSFNDQAYAGLERAQKELGIQFHTLETGEGADREAAMRQLAAGDAALIFGVGFLFTDDIKSLAHEFPDKKFACVDYTVNPGDTLPRNLVALKFKEEEGSFLVGALAALVSTTGKVGFVGGMQIPLIKKFEAGYVAGVHAVNPRAQVIIKYAGSTGTAFKDPTKGKELALAEYNQGADIIYHASGSTGLGVFEAAREKGRLAIGVDSDQQDEAPENILTSMVKRVDVAVFDAIRETTEGRWSGGVKTFGLADEGVTWVYDARNKARIPDRAKAVVDSLRTEIIAGRIVVPAK